MKHRVFASPIFKHFCFVLLASFLLACCPTVFSQTSASSPQPQSATDAQSFDAIDQVLHTQQDAWNRHDLNGFMAGYWNSPQLSFFSGATERDGWQATLDRYKASYASPGHEMGKLDFSGLRIETLGSDAAFVRGAWQLTMPDGKTPHGLFTLVFRKFPDGWKIVHDHTSVAE
jgi:ketosteroid isomerase-like protein